MTGRSWGIGLAAQSGLIQAAAVGLRIMMGYRALELGADPVFLGVLVASFSLPALFAALPTGRLSDRVGGAVVVLTGQGVFLSGAAVLLLWPTLWALLAGSAVTGLGFLLMMVGQQTLVAHQALHNTDGAFGNLSAAASIGQLVGPVLVAFVAAPRAGSTEADITAGVLACLGCVVLTLPAHIVFRRSDAANRATRLALRTVDRRALTVLRTPGLWRALVLGGSVLATSDLLYAFIPAWAAENGVDIQTVGWLLAIRAAASAACRFGLARLVAAFGRSRLLGAAALLGAVALAALPFAGLPGAYVVMLALGIALGLPQPLVMAWIVSITDPGRVGAALGLRLTANRFAQVTIPVLLGTVATSVGVSGIFWANAVFLAGAACVLPDRRRRR